ncbi:hypothetical protein [Acidisphaera sp. L21]|jgi:hypothetical protein|uniref:hypothetical protein n=1 Tax=Acidisphaera sp. L21 TaxID=1641851 RepID=UPI00131E20D8|nr:hypothetical protein [Acidisphaera sp. L21]
MPNLQTAKPTPPVSPLILADRLISLAQDADRAGYAESASRLLGLAYAVFDEQPRRN